ncbi:winged helix-turn-helix transcriptional regulator [Sphingomonas quercus]|nr:winged helix-turn-helix transcriptional regulator [Sphingomonas quercus]
MELIGERWSLLIVRELLLGPRRFGELRGGLPGLSANVLTQRLAALEEAGIIERLRLPPPANAQVYALTPWGKECEPVVFALARWALRSVTHNPLLNFSAVSLMLMFKMLLVPERAAGFSGTLALRLDGEDYGARLTGGALNVGRGTPEASDATLEGSPGVFLPVLFGGRTLADAQSAGDLRSCGNRAVAERFLGLFALPPKVAIAPRSPD